MMPAQLSICGPLRLGAVALAGLILGFGIWATEAHLAGAIMASGRLELPEARQVVQHPDGGVVAEILVRDGAVVAAGEVVLRLDGTELLSDLRIIEDRLSDQAAPSARLVAERDGTDLPSFPVDLLDLARTRPDIAALIAGQSDLFAARRTTLEETRAQLSRRIDEIWAQHVGVKAQREPLHLQHSLIETELAAQQSLLNRGLAPQTAAPALRRESARLAGEIAALTATLARLEDQVAEIGLQSSGFLAQRRETALQELREIGPAALEWAETRRALLGRIARLELRAPVARVVFGLQLGTARAVLRAAEPALAIVPQDRPLLVAARISPKDIKAVTLGQEADLVLSAVGEVEPPRLTGHVTLVFADALADPATGAAYYLVTLDLDTKARDGLGEHALLPGMPVEVYLQTGTRTPLAYLLEPFTDYFGRAMREG